MTKLTRLFEPICIGTMEVKNRIVFPPLATKYASVTGEATQLDVNHFAARARGGAGLLIVPWVRVENKIEIKKAGNLRLDSDDYIRGLNAIVEAVHLNDSKIAIQLSHGGRVASKDESLDETPASASESFCSLFGTTARALKVEEIEYLIEAFAIAAYRAKIAGFDAVELHGASGYLISQFLSPYVNKRTDRYGGDPSRRMAFALEIIERIKEKVGQDYPIMMRISGDEFVEGGLTLEDNKFIAKRLADAGIDCIDVTMGIVESYYKSMPPMAIPRGAYIYLAEGIKKVINIPVIAVGRINDPLLAEKILEEEKADLVAMGRALLADPELPNKARRGKLKDIRPCVACNRCVMDLNGNIRVRCAVNYFLGREEENNLQLTKKTKRLLVVGGGPAGMTAATIAALRGHKVLLYEKKSQLGGQLLLASVPPYKEELNELLSYLLTQIQKSGVQIMLEKEFVSDFLEKIKPDIVIMATGASQIIPKIPGIDRSNVVYAWDILRGEVKTGDRVVVVGGGMIGCETAEYLMEKGKDLTIVEMLPEIGLDMEPFSKIFILERFQKNKVKIFTSTKVEKINEDTVEAIDKNWNRYILNFDTVVIAVGSKPNHDVHRDLRVDIEEIYKIGDCRKPQRILEAIHEATHLALRI